MKANLASLLIVAASLSACGTSTPSQAGLLPDVGFAFDTHVGDIHADVPTTATCKGVPCTDDNPCTDDYCNSEGVCTHFNNKATCDDGDPCTTSDHCSAGKCAGTATGCGDSTSQPDTPIMTSNLQPGDLIITEIMYNPNGKPTAVSDDQGEWIEVFNPGNKTLDLAGLTLRDNGKDKFVIPAGGKTTVSAKGYIVLGRSTDTTTNGGVKVDIAYGNKMTLNNGIDAVVLETADAVVIDQVAYNIALGWPNLSGVSLSLSPSFTDATVNDVAANWCGALTEMGDGDKGTPGLPNDECVPDQDHDGVPDSVDNCPSVANPTQMDTDKNGIGDVCDGPVTTCGNGQIDGNEACDDGNLKAGDGCSGFCQKEVPVAAGALVISEFMSNPAKVADDVGEWIELYNPTTADVAINGLLLQIGTTAPIQHVVESPVPVVVTAGGYLLLARSADTAVNGGLTPDYVYDKLLLSSTAATLSLYSAGVLIDKVTYDTNFPLIAGKSASLDPGSLTAVANDDPANWCKGQAVFGIGDFGSPDAANPACAGADLDEDKDGIPDKADNCKSIKNPLQEDTDKDGIGNVCDNCPNIANADQADSNHNGVGDLCEQPGCGNGVLDAGEACDDGNLIAGDGCGLTCQFETAMPVGTLIISEIMANPKAVSDSYGEWIELYNPTTAEVDLAGMTLSIGSVKHTIQPKTPLKAPPLGFVVLGRSTDTKINGGANVDYSYGTLLTLSNSSTASVEIRLSHLGLVIDTVTYLSGKNGWPPLGNGASYQLSPANMSDVGNDAGSHWCLSSQPFGKGDLGTPGGANPECKMDADGDGVADGQDNCPTVANKDQLDSDLDTVGDACDNCPDVANTDQMDTNSNGIGDACDLPKGITDGIIYVNCGNGVVDAGETCDDGNKTSGDGCSSTCQTEGAAGPIGVGALVITEIMPYSVAGSADNGEWLEVYNTTAANIDLVGVTLKYKTISVVIAAKGGTTVVPAGGYLVLGRSTDKTANGGAQVDYSYGITIQMANTGGTLTLESGSTVIDTVVYGSGSGWPTLTKGIAIQLAAGKTDSVSNDTGSNWCNATAPYGTGMAGTPDAANGTCGAPPPPPPQSGFAPGNAQFDAYMHVFSVLMQGQLFGWL